MKLIFSNKIMLIIVLFILNSCSSDSVDDANLTSEVKPELIVNYTYTDVELETLNLINDYRSSLGLNRLSIINHISHKCEEHDIYMIDNKVLTHDYFKERSENIMKVLGAYKVGENIAFNFKSPKSALDGWLNSPTHKINIIGDYTHFGIAIKVDPLTGDIYYTNIFAKI